jgi:2-haloacid dehalogenase
LPDDPEMQVNNVPTTVVFDLGGVLIDWNPRYLYRSLFDGDEAAMERFLAEVCSPEWNVRQDAGRAWAEAIDELSARFPEERERIRAYRERWEEMLGGAIEPTVEILAELRSRGVRLLALSNWSTDTFAVARPRYPFLEWFEGLVISGDVGMAKPDPAIFRYLIDRFGLDPATTVYIDDVVTNVTAAAALGLHAIRFQDAASLRPALERLGLLATAAAGRG